MKILFVGEGPHDIGQPYQSPESPGDAGGTVPTLVRRAVPNLEIEGIGIPWRDLARWDSSGKQRGLAKKLTAAALISSLKHGCTVTIAVVDRDGDASRPSELQDGATAAMARFPQQIVIWGVAFESIEAWTLGAADAIAEELGTEQTKVLREYPTGKPVEELLNSSGKQEHRPKGILQTIAQIKHRDDCREFREEVAKRTNVESLAKVCDRGFRPFLEQLRSKLSQKGQAS